MIYTVTLNPAVDRELRVPEIAFDTVLRAIDGRVDYGGKGFNVSRMLMALGRGSTALGFAGGPGGRVLRDGLHALGIETDFTWINGETRTNVTVVTADHAHYVKVNEPGPLIAAEEQQALLAQIARLAAAGDWWVLSGSLPPGVANDYYAQITGLVQQAGGQVILDASGEALRLGCQAGPMLVKPNEAEAQELAGRPLDTTAEFAAAAGEIQGLGARNVVISLGKAGAVLVGPRIRGDGQAWLLSGPAAAAGNPIGAGDSLVGGLVWGLEQGLALPEALRWGIACGTATAGQRGTAVGQREEVQELVKRVNVAILA